MAGIAAHLGLETTFVDGTVLRYNMPEGQPMNLCGYGTIAALAVMGREGRFHVETPAGELGVDVQPYLLGMAMPVVTFGEPVGADVAAAALGLELSEIDGQVQTVGAGRPKLMVPVVSTGVLDRIVPDQAKVAEACAATGAWIYGQAVVARTMEV